MAVDIPKALSQLQPQIRRAAIYFTGSSTAADDILQDVSLALLKQEEQFRGDASLQTYALSITRNIAMQYLKRRAKEQPLEHEPEAKEFQSADGPDIGQLNRALSRLKTKYRDPLLLKEMEHYSYDEIATIMDIKVGTVKYRINHAKKELLKIYNSSEGAN